MHDPYIAKVIKELKALGYDTSGFENSSSTSSLSHDRTHLTLSFFLKAALFANSTDLPATPTAVSALIRQVPLHLREISQVRDLTTDLFDSLHAQLEISLSSRQEALTALLRTPQMTRLTHAACTPRQGPDAIFAVIHYRPYDTISNQHGVLSDHDLKMTDTIVLTYERRSLGTGNAILVAPRPIHRWLVDRWLDVKGPGAQLVPTTAISLKPDEATDDFLEIVAGLWDPGTPGPLSSLPEAVKAARSCLN